MIGAIIPRRGLRYGLLLPAEDAGDEGAGGDEVADDAEGEVEQILPSRERVGGDVGGPAVGDDELKRPGKALLVGERGATRVPILGQRRERDVAAGERVPSVSAASSAPRSALKTPSPVRGS